MSALVGDGVVIFDSLAIMEYASEIGAQPLLSKDKKQRARTRALLAWQHSGLSGICGQLSFESSFYQERRAMSAEEVQQSQGLFAVWEQELLRHAGPYLSGDLSLADLVFVPTVLRLLAHRPNLAPWPLTQAWTERLINRDSVREWLELANRLPVVMQDDYHLVEK